MNHDDVDTRLTAYVFGELSSQQTEALERELAQSSSLRDEVAAVRETVGALKSEFEAKATSVGESHRKAIEAAIEQRPWAAAQLDRSRARSPRAPWIAAVLAASGLVACALVYPYLANQTVVMRSEQDQVSESQPSSSGAVAPADRIVVADQDEEAGGLSLRADSHRLELALDSLDELSAQPEVEKRRRLQTEPGESEEVAGPFSAYGLAGDQESAVADDSLASPSADSSEQRRLGGRRADAGQPSPRGSTFGRDSARLGDDKMSSPSAEPYSSDAGNKRSYGDADAYGLMPAEADAEAPAAESARSSGAGSGTTYELRQSGRSAGDRPTSETSPTAGQAEGDSRAGTLSGGYGLPKDTTDVRAEQIKGRPFAAQVNDMLEILENEADAPAESARGLSRLPKAIFDPNGRGGEVADEQAAKQAPNSSRATLHETKLADQNQVARSSRSETKARGLGAELGFELESLNGVIVPEPAEADRLQAIIPQPASGDRFEPIEDNPFVDVATAPLSTFSIDVDTASYAKVRASLDRGALPRPDAVRIEELLNYFDYDYPLPQEDHPFAAAMEIAECPWNPTHRLARIGIKGKVVDETRPSSNLVFLLDVSGSMNGQKKMGLMIEGMKMLTHQLTENDLVSIVVYAGAAGQVLEPTRGDQTQTILDALDRLKSGGSTNGGQGIALAYRLARDNFVAGGVNRVILCTDGDFNVGVTGDDELVRLAMENAKSNVFLSALGFVIGDHNDSMMEKISNNGNGNYAFIDSESEAEKVFVEELGGTLVTIAKDVKIQVEFNPKQVSSYRLIGYENRKLAAQDFNDDKKDAGEIGAGHTVTALYEIVPAEVDDVELPGVDDLRYQQRGRLSKRADSGETLVLKLRYKQPEGDSSVLIERPVTDAGKRFSQADRDFQFAAAVAAFGMLLRDSPHKGDATFAAVAEIADAARKQDRRGYRQEFLKLVAQAKQLRGE